jgi:large subunit ribosomal protein L4
MQEEKIIVVDKMELAEMKTKEMKKTLDELGVESALIVIPEPDEKVERSARNLATVKVLRAEGINVYDILCYKHLILTEKSLRSLEKRLAPIQETAGVGG